MNSNVQFVQTMLKYTYGVVPIVAGLDKFTNLLTEWRLYISQALADVLPFDPSTFMIVVGIIEIIAGIIVLVKPKIGSFIVGAWLVCIAFSLIATWSYVDVAVRDLVMAMGAFSLFMITEDGAIASEELGQSNDRVRVANPRTFLPTCQFSSSGIDFEFVRLSNN